MQRIKEQYTAEFQLLAKAANRLAQLGYVTSHGGNLSTRVGENCVLLTPTKIHKRDIGEDDICAVDMAGKTIYAPPDRAPTSEVPFHLRIYRRREDIRAVVHAHPPVLTGYAIAGGDLLSAALLPEPATEVGPMLLVPYAAPGSDALADAVESLLDRSNGFLLQNHGALMTSGEDAARAVDLLEMMEGAAQSVLIAQALGGVRGLTPAQVAELGRGMPARGLPIPGKPGHFSSLEDAFS